MFLLLRRDSEPIVNQFVLLCDRYLRDPLMNKPTTRVTHDPWLASLFQRSSAATSEQLLGEIGQFCYPAFWSCAFIHNAWLLIFTFFCGIFCDEGSLSKMENNYITRINFWRFSGLFVLALNASNPFELSDLIKWLVMHCLPADPFFARSAVIAKALHSAQRSLASRPRGKWLMHGYCQRYETINHGSIACWSRCMAIRRNVHLTLGVF